MGRVKPCPYPCHTAKLQLLKRYFVRRIFMSIENVYPDIYGCPLGHKQIINDWFLFVFVNVLTDKCSFIAMFSIDIVSLREI